MNYSFSKLLFAKCFLTAIEKKQRQMRSPASTLGSPDRTDCVSHELPGSTYFCFRSVGFFSFNMCSVVQIQDLGLALEAHNWLRYLLHPILRLILIISLTMCIMQFYSCYIPKIFRAKELTHRIAPAALYKTLSPNYTGSYSKVSETINTWR